VVECKHQKAFRTSHLFHPTEIVKKYHAQVMLAHGRDPFGRYPLLVMRGSDKETYAALPLRDLMRWSGLAALGQDVLPVLYYACEGNLWVATTWERFLVLLGEHAQRQLAEAA